MRKYNHHMITKQLGSLSLVMTFVLVCALVATFAGCKKMIFDDLKDCNRGVYINLFDSVECASEASYPKLKELKLLLFDAEGTLMHIKDLQDVETAKDKEIFMPVPKPGRYRVVAWANLYKYFDIENIAPGKTKEEEMLFRIKSKNKIAQDITGLVAYQGKSKDFEIGQEVQFYAHTKINLREFTNRVNVRAVGLEEPRNFQIVLRSNNGTYNLNGDIRRDLQLQYPAEMKYPSNEKFPNEEDLFASFTTLRLITGMNNELAVYNVKTQEESFKCDLIGAILMSDAAANINLRCINDFEVLLKMKKCNCPGGYMVAEIWINDWLVHSYQVDLDV